MKKEKKICIIISNIDRWIPFEWIYFDLLEKGFQQSYILLTSCEETFFYKFLIDNNCPVAHIQFAGKKQYLSSLLKIISNLKSIRPDIVHCHFLDASVIGLLSAYFIRISKRIYTRHHGYFHHHYFPKGVWLDKLCNKLSTHIIAISSIGNRALQKEGVKKRKVSIVHHGFKLDEFEKIIDKRVTDLIEKYNQDKRNPVIGVIARHIKWKGVQHIIPAFKDLLTYYPNAFLILANARGNYHHELVKSLQTNVSQENYVLIPFEPDVQALYKLFGLYVHVPINDKIEAFGQTYVEALASGFPSVFTKSGIANDFIEHEKNALVVPFEDSNEITQGLIRLMEDVELRKEVIVNGKKDVKKLFTFDKMMDRLFEIYNQ